MGVSGSGKTTLATALADALGAEFLEGDSFHPPENVAWMTAGKPLTDEMRWPWLTALAAGAVARRNDGKRVIISCSALKRSYRDHLRRHAAPLQFIFLKAPENLLRERMEGRKNHYMPPSLLTSQLATLEPPDADEADCTTISSRLSRIAVFRKALAAINREGDLH
jgi:gluconokinase